MSLFPGIKVDGHGHKEGLDPNGGSLQSVIEKNIFMEADRGQPAGGAAEIGAEEA